MGFPTCALVSGGLTAQGWADLAFEDGAAGSAADGSPLFITGIGDTSNGVQTYLLSEIVPEPGIHSLMMIAGAGILLYRRRQRSMSFA